MNLAYDDRINRMIPAPCGVVKIYDPEEEKDRVVENLFSPSQDQDSQEEGAAAASRFPSSDIREKFKVIHAKPKLKKPTK